MRFTTFSAVIGLFSVASASPILDTRATPTNNTAPCAAVSSAYFAQTNPVPTVPAQLAYDCIKSVPLNVTSAKKLLGDIRPYINWQSTLAFLKNPPAEYKEKVQQAVDIFAGLDDIEAKVNSGAFKGEYEFGFALYQLVQSAHDGHFSLVPDSVGSIFNFGRTVPLVSVSEDGLKVPAVFAYADVLGQHFKNITYTPSAIVKIDGKDAASFLEDWSQWGSLQDRDALYNNVFYELAQVSLGTSGSGTGTFTGGGRGRWAWPGATTTFTFANGTSRTIDNYARVLVSMRGIDSGEKLRDTYFYFANAGQATGGNVNIEASPGDETPSSVVEAAAAAATTVSPPGYPPIVVQGPLNLINGYYIDSPGYEDVAVLSVPNFVGNEAAEVPFQQTTQNFVAKALKDGKKKLIVDVSANGGGTILQGYDLFKQLFPNILPYGATRFRAHEAADLVGQSYSALASKYPRTLNTINSTVLNVQSSYFDYHTDADVNYEPFTSWPEKYSPRVYNGDNYTGIARWNLSDVLITYNSGGINITGYGPRANFTQQSFDAADIVIVYDGYCASTCTIFSELMRQQAGVKAIAMGGRANSNPIQAVGGVKGTNNYQWGYIQQLAQEAVMLAAPEEAQRYNESVLKDYYSDTPFARAATAPGVNVRDGLREGDKSGTPLQFQYEEADCRLYYTPEMTVDATEIWKGVADAQWGGKGKCVPYGKQGYREKRDVTRTLGGSGLKKRGVADAKVLEALEGTFGIETENELSGDGFMLP
ncbi:peptidase S41 family protein [Lophium mytilinum]|uniref:Peptidase S41 family protein n=1 Tax=Lophium mytilinum TaxID=390894 RepID=A0A6A6QGY4_9PEZI|nr:peptidase S41 family protein [Lophium mytilinum]